MRAIMKKKLQRNDYQLEKRGLGFGLMTIDNDAMRNGFGED
jgi:hypothetical protein